jgi:hypothetical protein
VPCDLRLFFNRQHSHHDIEDKRFRLLKKDYREDLREYKEKHKAVGVMRTRIQETVSRNNLYAFDTGSVHEILENLQQRFAPDDETRERGMEIRYRSTQKYPNPWTWRRGFNNGREHTQNVREFLFLR